MKKDFRTIFGGRIDLHGELLRMAAAFRNNLLMKSGRALVSIIATSGAASSWVSSKSTGRAGLAFCPKGRGNFPLILVAGNSFIFLDPGSIRKKLKSSSSSAVVARAGVG